MQSETKYPDISDVLDRKRRGRRQLADLSFAEKLDILDRLRENELTFGAELRDAVARARKSEQP
ncbi:MAG: hypothetical protein ABL883_09130 [Terricaulis sp.]